jgi:proliferating cell nuclear antigen
MDSENQDILNLKTVQIAPIRTLFTALKDIILETNITFTPSSMKIVTMDKSHTVLVYLILNEQNFEHFYCGEEKIIIGVNMINLFKLMNSIHNDDTLTIYIDKNDYNDGIVSYLSLRFENSNISQCITQKLRLIEPDPEELSYPEVEFSSVIHLPSQDFQKIIRDLSSISDKVEIESVENELLFKCTGNFATTEIRRSESTAEGGMEFKKKQENGKIMQGIFSLKNLQYFIKCTNLCDYIELHLENDLPLVVKYDVATLGELKLCLSQAPSTTSEIS